MRTESVKSNTNKTHFKALEMSARFKTELPDLVDGLLSSETIKAATQKKNIFVNIFSDSVTVGKKKWFGREDGKAIYINKTYTDLLQKIEQAVVTRLGGKAKQ